VRFRAAMNPERTVVKISAPFQVGVPPKPVLGRSVSPSVVGGVVLYRSSKTGKFVPVGGQRLIPTGSEIDARRGTVRVRVVAPSGKVQNATVSGGRFIVTQVRSPTQKGGS